MEIPRVPRRGVLTLGPRSGWCTPVGRPHPGGLHEPRDRRRDAITFADRYGFHGERSSTACVTGRQVLDSCGGGMPAPYLVAAGVTGGLGLATFVAWLQLDAGIAEELDPDLGIYAVTRLVARLMNAAGAVFGVLLSNAVDFGPADAQRDFDVLQVLGAVHLGWSVATLGLETASTVLVM